MVSSIISQYGYNRDEVLDLSKRDFIDKLVALHPDSQFMSLMRARSSTIEERKTYSEEVINELNKFLLFKETVLLKDVYKKYQNNEEDKKLLGMMLGDIQYGRPDNKAINYSIHEVYNYILNNQGGVIHE